MNQCPRCSYSLEGLPEDHVCPECGLGYHGDTVFMPTRHMWMSWRHLVLGAGLTSWIMLYPGVRRWPFGEHLMIAWMVVVSASIIIYLLKARRSRKGELAIDRDGIRLTPPGLQQEFIRISDVREAKCSWWNGGLLVLGRDGRKLLSIPPWKLEGRHNCKECAYQINRHVFANRWRVERAHTVVD